MSPEEFKAAWESLDNNLNTVTIDAVDGTDLSSSTTDFLLRIGLPDSAAPFLSFLDGAHGNVGEVFGIEDPELDKYFMIGSCSNGDPIAINADQNDRVERLEHDNNFTAFYFNSSVVVMAECLLAYKEFVARVQRECGEDGYLEGHFTDEQYDDVKRKILAADGEIAHHGGFWREQFEMDIANRDYFRNERLSNK